MLENKLVAALAASTPSLIIMAEIISIQDKREIAELVTEHCEHKKLIPAGVQLRVEISLVPTQLVLIEETARVGAEIWNMDAKKSIPVIQAWLESDCQLPQ